MDWVWFIDIFDNFLIFFILLKYDYMILYYMFYFIDFIKSIDIFLWLLK